MNDAMSKVAQILILALACALPAASQESHDVVLDLPDGVTAKAIDLGLSGNVLVWKTPGLDSSYNVYFAHDEYEFTSGQLVWKGAVIGTLHCYSKKCISLAPGSYQARIALRNIEPALQTQMFERYAAASSGERAKLGEQLADVMDYAEIQCIRSKNGKPHGKPFPARFSIEWGGSLRTYPNLKQEFLTQKAAR